MSFDKSKTNLNNTTPFKMSSQNSKRAADEISEYHKE